MWQRGREDGQSLSCFAWPSVVSHLTNGFPRGGVDK